MSVSTATTPTDFHLNSGDINGLRQHNVICLVDEVLFLDAKSLEKLCWARVLACDDRVVLKMTILLSQQASLKAFQQSVQSGVSCSKD